MGEKERKMNKNKTMYLIRHCEATGQNEDTDDKWKKTGC